MCCRPQWPLTFCRGFAVCEAGVALHSLDCAHPGRQGVATVNIAAQVVLVGGLEGDHALLPALRMMASNKKTKQGRNTLHVSGGPHVTAYAADISHVATCCHS